MFGVCSCYCRLCEIDEVCKFRPLFVGIWCILTVTCQLMQENLFFQICICKESCILSFEYLTAVVDSYYTRLMCWMCLELARKTAERRQLTFL